MLSIEYMQRLPGKRTHWIHFNNEGEFHEWLSRLPDGHVIIIKQFKLSRL